MVPRRSAHQPLNRDPGKRRSEKKREEMTKIVELVLTKVPRYRIMRAHEVSLKTSALRNPALHFDRLNPPVSAFEVSNV
jgi:hypothetical protein